MTRRYLLALAFLAFCAISLVAAKQTAQSKLSALKSRVTVTVTDADTTRTTLELIQSRGFAVESYQTTTDDGYILTLHRIPAPGRPVVFLQHGLLDTSATFVINGKDESLGYILASAQYDVFLGNSRGNKYSLAHRSLPTTSPSAYWAFDFDHHAKYDLPASIVKALAVSKQSKLVLISHSQGATASLIALATVPGLADHVSLFIALAPVTYLKNSGSKVFNAMGKAEVDKALALLGDREIIPAPDQLSKLLGGVCKIAPSACAFSSALLFGPSTHIPNARAGVYAAHWPDRTSVRNMRHWIQNARSGGFNSFTGSDYSAAMKAFPVPVAVFSAGKDYLGDPKDTLTLVGALTASKKLVAIKSYPDLAHMDFVWAPDSNKTIYPDVLALVTKYAK